VSAASSGGGISALSRTLRRVDPDQLEALLSRWIARRIGPETVTQISIDGKTLRGSRDGGVPGQHLLAADAPTVKAVLAQVKVEATTHEHTAALRLLGILPLAGQVVVGDAMFCQRDVAEAIVDRGGDDVPTVKENPPGLGVDIRSGFAFESAARSIAAATSP
jgi:hypothetical protein